MGGRVEKFVGASLEIDNITDLSAYFCDFVSAKFELPYVGYLLVADKFKRHPGPVVFRAARLPDGFKEHYERNELTKVDPFLRIGRLSPEPVLMDSIIGRPDILKPEEAFLDSLPGWGIRNVLTLTVCGHPGQIAYAGCATDSANLRLSALDIRAFRMIAHEMHARYQSLLGNNTEPRLTSREIEVMNWIVQGKTNSYIAASLQISPHTVDTLLRRCFGKLNASTRLEAALKSVSLGIALA
ncbi:MAG: LuxR C-terminal-related transcriptional regulator [Amphiplicatus sp.]